LGFSQKAGEFIGRHEFTVMQQFEPVNGFVSFLYNDAQLGDELVP